MVRMWQADSSNIQAVGYDPAGEVLTVRFKNGYRYQYHQVAAPEFAHFMAADSLGAYLAAHIKPHYTAVKLPPAEES